MHHKAVDPALKAAPGAFARHAARTFPSPQLDTPNIILSRRKPSPPASGLCFVPRPAPAGGTVGDQSKWITFYGDNLFNSNGNLPYFSIGGTGTLSVTAQGGNPGGQSSTPSQLFATYSIAPGNQLMMDPIIDVITDAGTSLVDIRNGLQLLHSKRGESIS
jgi:hypothetical protein